MKRLSTIILLALFGLAASAFAQTQQGYVKTKGRMMNGKYTAGKRISDATVQVKDRSAVKSRTDGTFSFPVSGKSYSLQQVQKQGYVLLDQDVLYKQYSYSSNPLEIVMEDKAQLEADRRALERQVRRITDEELRRRGEEIEALKEQNDISEERYRELLNKLNNDYDLNEKLIKDMVEQYNKIDFDQHDEFNRRVSDCIINGRLDEADSLLHTKGDVNKLIDQLNKHHVANEQARVTLSQSEAAEEHERQEIAQICYNKYLIFKMQHKNDSAAYYIELRANLDTTNVMWQDAVGNYLYKFVGDLKSSLLYYKRALRHSIDSKIDQSKLYTNIGQTNRDLGNIEIALKHIEKALEIDSSNTVSVSEIATDYDNLSTVYYEMSDLKNALKYAKKALAIREEERVDLDYSYNNISQIYQRLGDYSSALDYSKKALACMDSTDMDNPLLGSRFNNLGSNYDDLSNRDMALYYYEKALVIKKNVLSENHPDIARSYNNIALTYMNLGKYSESLENYKKALQIFRNSLGENNPLTAQVYFSIGSLFLEVGKDKTAIAFFEKSATILEEFPEVSKITLGNIYNGLGLAKRHEGEYEQSVLYFQKTLDNLTQIYGQGHPDIATVYDNIGISYSYMGDNNKGLYYAKLALAVREKTIGKHHEDVGLSYLNIGSKYNELAMRDSVYADSALFYFSKAQSVYDSIDKPNPSHLASLYNNIGSAYSLQNNLQKGLEYSLKSLEVAKEIYGENNIKIAVKYDNVGSVYKKMGEYNKAIEYHQHAIDIYMAAETIDSVHLAISLNNIGVAYRDKGDYETALDYLNKAYDIYRNKLGEENTGTKIILKNLNKAIELKQKGSDK